MDNKTVVYLLKRNIKELEMITEGLEEMREYPTAIILLAQKKTEEILDCVNQLEASKHTAPLTVLAVENETSSELNESLSQEEPLSLEDYVIESEDEKIEIKIEREEAIKDLQPQEKGEFEMSNINAAEQIEETEETETDVVTYYSNSASEKTSNDVLSAEKAYSENGILPKKESLNGSQTPHIAQNRLVDTHNNGKVADIRQAVSLGDRFLFQRTLFDGNGEEMNKLLLHINSLNSFDEAVQFVQSKYNWEEESEAAETFYQALRRRF